jgi:hypothetical protein
MSSHGSRLVTVPALHRDVLLGYSATDRAEILNTATARVAYTLIAAIAVIMVSTAGRVLLRWLPSRRRAEPPRANAVERVEQSNG